MLNSTIELMHVDLPEVIKDNNNLHIHQLRIILRYITCVTLVKDTE